MILSVERSTTSVLPGRFQIHGLTVEVEPSPDGAGWRARVVPADPGCVSDWRLGRNAWRAIDAAAIAHLAASPPEETYQRLLAPSADKAEQLAAA